MKIFAIIRKDEPSHWAPYEGWLARERRREPRWWERAIDGFIHSELLFLKLPARFLHPWVGRRAEWPDAGEQGDTAHRPPAAAVASGDRTRVVGGRRGDAR